MSNIQSSSNHMSYSSSNNSSNIIIFHKVLNIISPNFYANIVLRSRNFKICKILCIITKSENEFQEVILLLLIIIHMMKYNTEFDDFTNSLFSFSSLLSLLSFSSDSSMSIDIIFLSYTSIL